MAEEEEASPPLGQFPPKLFSPIPFTMEVNINHVLTKPSWNIHDTTNNTRHVARISLATTKLAGTDTTERGVHISMLHLQLFRYTKCIFCLHGCSFNSLLTKHPEGWRRRLKFLLARGWKAVYIATALCRAQKYYIYHHSILHSLVSINLTSSSPFSFPPHCAFCLLPLM